MKLQYSLLASAALLLSLSLNAQDPVTQVKSANEPYKVQYKDLEIGNVNLTQKVLQSWKEFETNNFQKSNLILADNVRTSLPDGSTINGIEAFYTVSREMRNSLAAVVLDVDAITTVKSPDDPQHEFVLAWGSETDTKKDGTIEKFNFHEVWTFNKEGKAVNIQSYAAAEKPGNKQEQVAQVKSVNQPYKVHYEDLKIGNLAYTQTVLKLWKEFATDNLDKHISFFSDNIVSISPDGTVVKGAENFHKIVKDYRNSLAAVTGSVRAITTLKSPSDPDHEFVVIWGTGTNTKKDGSVQKTHNHEIWAFNKQGKIDEIRGFEAADSPVNKK